MNIKTCLALGIFLLWPTSAFAAGATVSPPDSGEIILAMDTGGSLPLAEILRLEPGHLLALGLGIAAGAVVFGPVLGAGEVVGVAIGVLSSEIFYRSYLWPLDKPNILFQLH